MAATCRRICANSQRAKAKALGLEALAIPKEFGGKGLSSLEIT